MKFFKTNITNGEVYLQIWDKPEKGPPIYVASLGTAEKHFNKLVTAGLLSDQTKKEGPIPTKNPPSETQTHDQTDEEEDF